MVKVRLKYLGKANNGMNTSEELKKVRGNDECEIKYAKENKHERKG